MKQCMTKAVENVRFKSKESSLPIFSARNLRVPVCKMLFNNVNMVTNPPTTLLTPKSDTPNMFRTMRVEKKLNAIITNIRA